MTGWPGFVDGVLPVIRIAAKNRTIIAMNITTKPVAIEPSAERMPFQNGTAMRSRPSSRVKARGILRVRVAKPV